MHRREPIKLTVASAMLAREAAAFARQSCPDFLFNHCMRTFTFGALLLQRRRLAFDAETAFVASALHDLGLLQPFESSHGSFEVEMHDGHWAVTLRQGPEAMLVALGAGADVYGPEPGDFDDKQVAEIRALFPRQQFKQGFTALLIAHCQRKPDSQHGTWLEGVCRRHASGAEEASVEQRIAAAPFPE